MVMQRTDLSVVLLARLNEEEGEIEFLVINENGAISFPKVVQNNGEAAYVAAIRCALTETRYKIHTRDLNFVALMKLRDGSTIESFVSDVTGKDLVTGENCRWMRFSELLENESLSGSQYRMSYAAEKVMKDSRQHNH